MAADAETNANLDLDDDVPQEITWPKTMGIASIVWATIGMGCIGCGAVGIAMQGGNNSGPPGWGPMPDVMKQPPSTMVLLAVGVPVAILLLIAGILLIKRNPLARTLHLVYAVIGLVNTGVSTFLSFQHQLRVLAWAKDNPDDQWGKMMAGGPWMVLGMVVGLVLGGAWPLFCLVWFGLVKRTKESMVGKVEA
ncbi:MAG: hypothetical protein ACKVS8_14450 [Phycisphaerales bacterium]